jgi:hypothetical protein
MVEQGKEKRAAGTTGDGYPLKATTAMLNDRLGLYLSESQQRGFAAGLLIGTAVAGALLAWSLSAMLRRDD